MDRDCTGIVERIESFESRMVRILKLALDFPFHFPAHAGVTAAAIGAADFDSIDGGDHSPAGPVGLQDAISLQLLGHLATQIAEGANPFVQCAAAALRLNPVKRTKLAS